jgi:hypothetical protein
MKTEQLPDGTTKETYDTQSEYETRGRELEKTMGRSKLFYNGYLNGKLVRIYR